MRSCHEFAELGADGWVARALSAGTRSLGHSRTAPARAGEEAFVGRGLATRAVVSPVCELTRVVLCFGWSTTSPGHEAVAGPSRHHSRMFGECLHADPNPTGPQLDGAACPEFNARARFRGGIYVCLASERTAARYAA